MLGIVIPAYKRPECLREALWSLVSQTNKKFFVIVVDDASPEPLEPICKEFEKLLHIKYVRQNENGGPGIARQAGLELCYKANFDLVMFLDSDDKLYPHAIARLTYEINHNMADLASSAIWSEDKNGTGNIIEANNKTWLHGKIFRTSYLKNNNICFPPMRDNEDLAFNLVAIENSNKKILINEPLYLFHWEDSSITRNSELSLTILSFNYITAIYTAAKYLVPKNKFSPQMIANTFACYNYYQIGKLLIGEPSADIKQQCHYLLNLPEIKDMLNNNFKLIQIDSILHQFFYYKKNLYWFNQNFNDWVKEINHENNSN